MSLINYYSIESFTPIGITITTNWNDSSSADGAYSLSITQTGDATFYWLLPDGSIRNGDTFTITADSGILDGTNKQIMLLGTDFSQITNFNWEGKKIVSDLDISIVSPNSWSVNNNAIANLTLPDLNNSTIFHITDLSVVSNIYGLESTSLLTDIEIFRNNQNVTFDFTNVNFGGVFYSRAFGATIPGIIILPSSNSNNFTSFRYQASRWTGILDLSGYTGTFTGTFDIQSSLNQGLILPPTASLQNITTFNISQMSSIYINTPNIAINNGSGNVTNTTFSRNGINLNFDLTNYNFSGLFFIDSFGASRNGLFTFPLSNSNNFTSFIIEGIANTTLDLSGFTGTFTGTFTIDATTLTSLTLPINLQGVSQFSIINSGLRNYYNTIGWGTDIRASTINLNTNTLGIGGTPRGNDIVADILTNIANMSVGAKTLTMQESASDGNNVGNPNLSGQGVIDANDLVNNHNYTITYWDGAANVTLS